MYTSQCLLLSVINTLHQINARQIGQPCAHSNRCVDSSSAETSTTARNQRDSISPSGKAHLAAIDCVCRWRLHATTLTMWCGGFLLLHRWTNRRRAATAHQCVLRRYDVRRLHRRRLRSSTPDDLIVPALRPIDLHRLSRFSGTAVVA